MTQEELKKEIKENMAELGSFEIDGQEVLLNKEDIINFDTRAARHNKEITFKLNNDFLYKKFAGWNGNEFKILLALFELYHKATRKKQDEIEFSNIEVERSKDPRRPGFIKILFKDLRDLSNTYRNKNGYIQEIVNSLKTIKGTSISFNIGGSKVHTSFIQKVVELEYDNPQTPNKEILIQFDSELFDLFDNSGNFTQIDPNINYLRSKYAIRLYKIIKEQSQKKHGWLDLSLEELKEIFDSGYDYISKFKKHLDNALLQMDKEQLLRYSTKGQILPKKFITMKYEKEKIRISLQYGEIISHISNLHKELKMNILRGESI